jgi:hypothetical protein
MSEVQSHRSEAHAASKEAMSSEWDGDGQPVRLSRGRKLLFTGLLLVTFLVVVEVGLRLLSPAQLGFVYENEVFRHPPEFEADRTVNEARLHDVPHGPKAAGVTRVVLLGDSYVAAWSVPVEATVGRRLEHYLNAQGDRRYEVVSIGQPGWGQGVQLRALRDLAAWADPDWVVTLFLSFNDVRDDSPALCRIASRQMAEMSRMRPGWMRIRAEDAPLFVIRSSRLNQLISHRLALWSDRRGAAAIPVDYMVYADGVDPVWEEAWGITEDLLLETRETAGDLGARYALVCASTPHGVFGAEEGLARLTQVYPAMADRTWDLDAPDERVVAFCGEHGIPALRLEPIFREVQERTGQRLHWPYDGHWNKAGNDLAGERIATFLLGLDGGHATSRPDAAVRGPDESS